MIVVTGGAGFIGSAVVWGLNKAGRDDILIVDRLERDEKWRNLVSLRYHRFLHADAFIGEIRSGRFKKKAVDAIVHMGACSSTTECDADYLMKNNYAYSLTLAEFCIKNNIRFIYASSAATYGNGSLGYDDDNETIPLLRPLNIYGYSKHAFDLTVIREGWDTRITGLKFFNVFGPNEYHKGDMRSVVHKAWQTLNAGETFRLFKSHRPDFADGEQKRDFVWIKDVVQVVLFFLAHKNAAGMYNVGSGKASSFNELLRAVGRVCPERERPSTASAPGGQPQIEYMDMPESLRERYQYFTEAKIGKLARAGYTTPFTPLADAVAEYAQEYLKKNLWLSP
jgi:ADP-L-glycero-D-manno-heptose 6-epimerase